MSRCDEFQLTLRQVLADEILAPEELLAHTEACSSCKAILGLHGRIGAMGEELPEPTDLEWHELRRNVRVGLGKSPHAPSSGWWVYVLSIAASLVLGFLAAHWLGETGQGDPLYRNIAFESSEDGQLLVNYEVAQSKELERDVEDPLVTELLVQSMHDSSSVYRRLQAIRVAQDNDRPPIRESLIRAMREDPAVAVRLSAMEALFQLPLDDSLVEAFASVLAHERSVQLRLRAVEHLANSVRNPEQLDRILRSAVDESDLPVRVKMEQLRDNNQF